LTLIRIFEEFRKVAHVRLCHSRMLFVWAYPRETQEMVFDAHDRAFPVFKGTRGRGIYDNMKTAVETIFVGKDRLYNRRFLQMCSHYLIDPVACTPGRPTLDRPLCSDQAIDRLAPGLGYDSRAERRARFRCSEWRTRRVRLAALRWCRRLSPTADFLSRFG